MKIHVDGSWHKTASLGSLNHFPGKRQQNTTTFELASTTA